MRRTFLFVAVVLLVVGFVALPAATSTPWPAPSPVYELDCTYSGEDVYYVQPVRGGAAGWDIYGSTDPRPFAVLMYSIVEPAPPDLPNVDVPLLRALGDRVTMCAVRGPVMQENGTWVYDPSWDIDLVSFWVFFMFF